MVARHFLCCLPLRLGALLISLVQLVLGGLIAVGAWYSLTSLRGRLPSKLKGIIIASAVYYSALALTSLIGLIGALGRKASLLSTYAFYLSWSVGVQIVIDAVYLWGFLSTSRETIIQRCIDGSTDKDVQNICNSSFDTGKWTTVAGIALGLVIQIWAAYIVASYAEKLSKEKSWRSGPGVVSVNDGGAGTNYAHVKQDDRDEAHIPLTGASYAYAYRDGNHSFGNADSHRTPPV